MKQSRRLLKFLAEKRSSLSPLLILTHNFPDPDAISSAFALQFIAENYFRISTRIVYSGIISSMENRNMVRILKIPIHKLKSGDFKKYRNVALVDTQPDFANNQFPRGKRATMIIDQHHADIAPKADLVAIDTECGATAVILAEALVLLKAKIPLALATALVYGILTDTFNLYRAQQRRVFDIYLKVLAQSDMQSLVRIQNTPKPKTYFVVFRRALQNSVVLGNLIYCHLGEVNDPIFVSHVVDFLLGYKGMKWAFCTGRFSRRLYMSLRSAGTNMQASSVLRNIIEDRTQAGGHGAIAGGNFYVGSMNQTKVWNRIESGLIRKLAAKLKLTRKKTYSFG